MLTAVETQRFRKVLVLLGARVRGDVEQLEEEVFSAKQSGDHGSSNHLAEMGTDAWEMDFSMRIVENDQELLSEIAAALNRIEARTYGQCEMCLESGVPARKANIPKSRLNTIPYARNCIECERQREQESSQQ
jgi:DnaK suppressor protein